ncbi:hypothetical protein M514_10789, partial [Trichuris suis]
LSVTTFINHDRLHKKGVTISTSSGEREPESENVVQSNVGAQVPERNLFFAIAVLIAECNARSCTEKLKVDSKRSGQQTS